MIIRFGPHNGKDITEIPASYLSWGARTFVDKKRKKVFEEEVDRRREVRDKDLEKQKQKNYINKHKPYPPRNFFWEKKDG